MPARHWRATRTREIADELRELLEQVSPRLHPEPRDIEIEFNEMHISLSGDEVGYGFVKLSEFVPRIENVSKLFNRIIERLSGIPYRVRGSISKELVNERELFVSAPMAGSFGVKLKLGILSDRQLPVESVDASATIDEFMQLMTLVNSRRVEAISERIPDHLYLHNFFELAKKIAPDGIRIRKVSFAGITDGIQRSIEFTRPAADISPLSEARSEPQHLVGVLLGADMTRRNSDLIKIVDDHGKTHEVHVPKGQINNIVQPMWYSRILIYYTRQGNRNVLEHIYPYG